MKTSKLASFVAATIISIISVACATVEQRSVATPDRIIASADTMNADAVVEAHRLESSFSFPEVGTAPARVHEAPPAAVTAMVHADDDGHVVAAK